MGNQSDCSEKTSSRRASHVTQESCWDRLNEVYCTKLCLVSRTGWRHGSSEEVVSTFSRDAECSSRGTTSALAVAI